jgi:heme/copper-type cytochrome/quinol oxidase subunit 2
LLSNWFVYWLIGSPYHTGSWGDKFPLHQWYWSYQYSDFLNDDNESIEFDSYMIPEDDLEDGGLRMLEVDNRVILPELTHVRFVVTAADVIHSFA